MRLRTSTSRRGGRVVECTALEMRRGGNSTGGSNPSLSATNSLILKVFLELRGILSQPSGTSRLFALALPRTQLETASSEPKFAMQSRRSLMGYFALGIRALHSTTSSRADFMPSSMKLSAAPRKARDGRSWPEADVPSAIAPATSPHPKCRSRPIASRPALVLWTGAAAFYGCINTTVSPVVTEMCGPDFACVAQSGQPFDFLTL